MIIVTDTSALIAVAADEATKPRLIAATRGADLVAPESIPAEVGNALSSMLKRKRITRGDADRVLAAYHTIPVQLVPFNLGRALDIAHQSDIYAYDAYVLDCALAGNAPLLSLDRGQREAARQLGITLHRY